MKKTLTLFLMFLLFTFCAFADDSSYRVFFPSLASDPVYPIESTIGQIAAANQTEEHKLLSKALSEPFSFEWCETYLAENTRKNITTLYSALLSDLLPSNEVLFSRANNNADNSVTISVKFPNSDDVLTFVVLENRIIGMTSAKK